MNKTWTYKIQLGRNQPQTTITGSTFEDLFEKTKKYFSDRKININSESVAIQIRRQNEGSLVKRKLTIKETISGAMALLKLAGGKEASKEEIRRRAEICSVCPKMDASTECMACGGSKRVAEIISTIRSRYGSEIKIPVSVKSKYCGVCGCSLALLIVSRFNGQTNETEQQQAERPQFCWLKKSSPKFTQE